MKEDSGFSKMIDAVIEEDRQAYFVDTCISYNVQWMERILKHTDLNDKTAVSQKIACYLHMIEAELRRSFDV